MEIFSTIFGDSVIDLQSRVKIPKSMHWSVDLSDAQRIFTTDSVNRLMKGTEHEIKWHYTAPSMKQVYYFTKIFTIGMTVTIANINMGKWECLLFTTLVIFFPQLYRSLKRDNEKLLQKHTLFLTSTSTSTSISYEDTKKFKVEKHEH